MNLKKVATVLFSCALAGAVLVGCGGQQAAQNNGGQDSKDAVKTGMLTQQNLSEDKLNELIKEKAPQENIKIIYFDSLSAMQMGLDSGNIQQMDLFKSVGKYLIDRNNKLEVKEIDNHPTDEFCFGLRKEDDTLKADLDKVIKDMKADGTLDKLTKQYITDLKAGQEPPAVKLPFQPGEVPLRIAVTGDLPPLDFVKADGTAAGFNTAILAEIGNRLHRSIEVVQVASGARGSALLSKKVDVVFWTLLPDSETNPEKVGIKGLFMPRDADIPNGMALSDPYYKDELVHIVKK